MQRILTLSLLAFVVVAASCGSGGSGSGGGAPDEQSGLAAGFVADQPSPGAETVSAGQDSASNDIVVVEINLTDTSGVHGVAFDLNYDANQADYLGYDEGSLLEEGGASVNYFVAESTPGKIVVSATRLGSGSGADADGTETVIRLTFRVEEVGASPVSFSASYVLDDAGANQMPGIGWFGGDLTGV
jgi:hypothetical protein